MSFANKSQEGSRHDSCAVPPLYLRSISVKIHWSDLSGKETDFVMIHEPGDLHIYF